jgi:hypothetical protein
MGVSPVRPGIKNDCAGEGQQKFTWQTDSSRQTPPHVKDDAPFKNA